MRRMTGGGGPGGQIFNIGKSKAALFDADNKVKITFDDVAGLEEAKEEVKEIVDFGDQQVFESNVAIEGNKPSDQEQSSLPVHQRRFCPSSREPV